MNCLLDAGFIYGQLLSCEQLLKYLFLIWLENNPKQPNDNEFKNICSLSDLKSKAMCKNNGKRGMNKVKRKMKQKMQWK